MSYVQFSKCTGCRWQSAPLMNTTTIGAFTSIVLLAALAGCVTAPHIRLAPELAGVEPWPVQGNHGSGQIMEFGRWQVTSPATFVTQGRSIGGGDPLTLPDGTDVKIETSTRLIEDLTTFKFTLASQADSRRTTAADCHAAFRLVNRTVVRANSSDETELTQPGYPHFDCDFAGAEPGKLTVRPHYTQRDAGTFEFSGQTWRLRTVAALEKGIVPGARFGYEFLREGRVVGAVQTFGDGSTWMHPDLSPAEEDQLALIATALLYFDSLLELRDS